MNLSELKCFQYIMVRQRPRVTHCDSKWAHILFNICVHLAKKRLKIKISDKLASSADDIIIVEDFLFKILENVSIWKEILLTSRLKPKNPKT